MVYKTKIYNNPPPSQTQTIPRNIQDTPDMVNMMKKTIILGLVLLTLASATAAYHLDNIPRKNPRYSNYFDHNEHLREDKFRNAIKRFRYQKAMSPYILVRSPYGKKPWKKPYGDNKPREEKMKPSYNPFYGFSHIKRYHCHNPHRCHYHNQFPN